MTKKKASKATTNLRGRRAPRTGPRTTSRTRFSTTFIVVCGGPGVCGWACAGSPARRKWGFRPLGSRAMGVKNLWKLLAAVGRRVSVESLSNKVRSSCGPRCTSGHAGLGPRPRASRDFGVLLSPLARAPAPRRGREHLDDADGQRHARRERERASERPRPRRAPADLQGARASPVLLGASRRGPAPHRSPAPSPSRRSCSSTGSTPCSSSTAAPRR